MDSAFRFEFKVKSSNRAVSADIEVRRADRPHLQDYVLLRVWEADLPVDGARGHRRSRRGTSTSGRRGSHQSSMTWPVAVLPNCCAAVGRQPARQRSTVPPSAEAGGVPGSRMGGGDDRTNQRLRNACPQDANLMSEIPPVSRTRPSGEPVAWEYVRSEAIRHHVSSANVPAEAWPPGGFEAQALTAFTPQTTEGVG